MHLIDLTLIPENESNSEKIHYKSSHKNEKGYWSYHDYNADKPFYDAMWKSVDELD